MSSPFRIFSLLAHVRRPSRIGTMSVVTDGFWLRRGYQAMTFFGTVVAATEGDARQLRKEGSSLLRHEMIHLRQAQSLHDSWLLFYVRYLWYSLLALPQCRRMKGAAYLLNPFEMEAYRHEGDAAYLERCSREGGATEWRRWAALSPMERLRWLESQT